MDDHTRSAYEELVTAFQELATSAAIWDVTTRKENDRARTRAAAGLSIDRSLVRFSLPPGGDGALQTEAACLRLENTNGADLLIYPGFVLMQTGPSLALIDLREVSLEFTSTSFLEEGPLPADVSVVGHAWAKSNRDGSPDRRFKENYQIPVVQYGQLALTSAKGLNEEYMLSSVPRSEAFARAFSQYQAALRSFGSSTGALDGQAGGSMTRGSDSAG